MGLNSKTGDVHVKASDASKPEFVVFLPAFEEKERARSSSCGKGCRGFELYFESNVICFACLLLQL